MVDITIALEDLETLIFGAAAVKAIEVAMDTRKRDPFVPSSNKITEALNRLTSEARSARRSKEDYQTPWDGELDGDENNWIRVLWTLYDKQDPLDRGIWMYRYALRLGAFPNGRHPAIDRLAAKGMIVIGSAVSGAIWPGVEQPELKLDPTFVWLRLTPRGIKKAEELKHAAV